MRIVTVDQMRALEAAADQAGHSYRQMMDVAGRAVAERIQTLLPDRQESRVLFLIGKGNNGGDGLVAARILRDATLMTVGVVTLRTYDDEEIKLLAAQHVPCNIFANDKLNEYRATTTMAMMADVIVDAVLGTGATLPLREEAATLLREVGRGIRSRQQIPQMAERPQRILAVDLPSGVDADTGQAAPEVLPATETITFEALKPGHVCYPGAGLSGAVMVAPLSLPPAVNHPPLQQTISAHEARALLPKRPVDANKGTFGRALVVAGSSQYVGAVALAAEAAYRVGAGLVTVATPAVNVPLLASRLVEATWIELSHEYGAIDESAADTIWNTLPDFTALLIGPGVGQAECTGAFMDVLFAPSDDSDPLPTTYPDPPSPALVPLSMALTERGGQARRAGEDSPPEPSHDAREVTFPPLVIDADALNLLAKLPNWWTRLPPNTILTPHPGEMARLAGIEARQARSGAQQVQADRYRLAREKAATWGCVLVLKGANTIVAAPDGRTAVIPIATPALSRAGTGDVLAGAICGYLAQGLAPFEAAWLGAFVQGNAGVLAAAAMGTTASVLASDVLAAIPSAITALERTAP